MKITEDKNLSYLKKAFIFRIQNEIKKFHKLFIKINRILFSYIHCNILINFYYFQVGIFINFFSLDLLNFLFSLNNISANFILSSG